MATTAQGNIDELKRIYQDLDKMGAMVNPKRAPDPTSLHAAGRLALVNCWKAQQAHRRRLCGTYQQHPPGLMQSLAKATGMTGKQLDSNADVKLFMATVTDPTKSYQANLAAIQGV